MHEDLTSYDCIVIIITVYPHNINIKLEKVKNIKKLVSTPTHPTYFHLLKREREREKYSLYYMVISLSVYLFCLYYLFLSHYTLVLYHWNIGESVLCTYVPLFVTLLSYLPS